LPEGYYEWYYPPVLALAALCAGVALTRLRALVPRTSALVAVGLVALFAWALPAMVVLDSRLQHEIEDRVRVPLGLWLRDNVPPGQSVTSESAGYVGYFGRVKLLDYPGLTSPEALSVLQRLGPQRNSMDQLIAAARPDFLLLRPQELTMLAERQPATLTAYAEVARFGVPFEETRLEWGGVAMVNIDREFVVLRRRDA
jgi:hypothetical protein